MKIEKLLLAADVYKALRKVLPGLPEDNVTELTLHLNVRDAVPEVTLRMHLVDGEGRVQLDGDKARDEVKAFKIVPQQCAIDVEYEKVGFQYAYYSYLTPSGIEWRDSHEMRNGQHPHASRHIYARKERVVHSQEEADNCAGAA